ncbi:MAG TPA: AIR synthase-related protein, partial [Pyrinomonadaceae bacterium]
ILPVFEEMQQIGNVTEREMYRTFNMGVGMVVVCAPSDKDEIRAHVERNEAACYEIGRVIQGQLEVAIR